MSITQAQKNIRHRDILGTNRERFFSCYVYYVLLIFASIIAR